MVEEFNEILSIGGKIFTSYLKSLNIKMTTTYDIGNSTI
jgi:hypothetical protein